MEVKQVVAMAVDHIKELFEHEQLSNLGLEEVDFDDRCNEWVVTVGFSRPWDYPPKAGALAELAVRSVQPKRSFKVVRVSDDLEKVLSVKNWVAPESNAF